MKRMCFVGLLTAVVASCLGLASCGEDINTVPPGQSDSGTADTFTAQDSDRNPDDVLGSDTPTDGAPPKCPDTVKSGKIAEFLDPASGKKAIVNDAIKLTGVIATSRKFRVQNVTMAGDSCLFGIFVADANATFAPYSGVLVLSYGNKAEARDGGGATCPLGTDLIPEDSKPGDVLDLTATYTEFVTTAAFCGGLTPPVAPPVPDRMPQLFKTCQLTRTSTSGTVPAPAVVTVADVQNSAPNLPKYVGGLVKVSSIEAETKVGPTPDRNFGKFKVKGAQLKVGDRIWYRGSSMTVAVGTQFESVTGLMYSDFCDWTIEPNACADMVVKSGGGPVCPAGGGGGGTDSGAMDGAADGG